MLDLLNELIDLVDEAADPERVSEIYRRLCAYALTHFSREERYLQAAGYADLARQKEEHGTFIHKLLELDHTYGPTDPRLLTDTRQFLQHWYLDHILHSDMQYVKTLKRFATEAPVKAVLFDFGNVICQFDHRRFLEVLAAACGKSVETLQALIFEHSELPRAYESGAIDSSRFLAKVSALCGHDFPEADFIQAFTGIFTLIEATLDLIRKLKPHYKLGLISDTNPWHFEFGIRNSEVFPLFDSVTLSYEVGAMKPDPRLFEDALEKLDLLAEECVYINDRPPFAEVATAHLLRGIAYTSPEALLARLRQLKVAF